MQIAKRIVLFLLVNLLVMSTVTVILGLLGAGNYFPHGGLAGLAVVCLVWGMVGSFISLALSRVMAKWLMGVQIVPPDTNDPTLRELVDTVHGLARSANLPALPEVGIYQSPDVNAFATGPTRSRALVAVSSGLLQSMGRREVSGVLGHEIAHIANGDMVTMALVQGVVNAFAMFLARVLAFVISQAMRSRDDNRGGGMIEWIMIMVFQNVFMLLGFIVVAWFSRMREFRADAGGARYAGRENMVNALKSLARLHDPEIAAADAQRAPSFNAFKISGKPGSLFATHPPLEVRIARLEEGRS